MGLLKITGSVILISLLLSVGVYLGRDTTVGRHIIVTLHLEKAPIPLPVREFSTKYLGFNSSSSENDAASQSGAILGTGDTAQTPNLIKRGFEDVRYQYCQQVVKDYQSRYQEKLEDSE